MSLALAALLVLTGPAIGQDVQAVIDRSHATRVNYTVVLRVRVVRNGVASIEDNAEYQLGKMHRVEVPSTRVLANCDTGQSIIFDVAQSKLKVDDNLGGGACGIAVNADKVISARRLAPIKGSFGTADVIELVGENLVRRYSVTPDGIIVSNDWMLRGSDGTFVLKTLSTKLVRGRPDPRLFKTASLTKPALSSH